MFIIISSTTNMKAASYVAPHFYGRMDERCKTEFPIPAFRFVPKYTYSVSFIDHNFDQLPDPQSLL